MRTQTLLGSACTALIIACVMPFEAHGASKGECQEPGHREVKFTTQQTSMVNLDVSPDGRWIVFDTLGDLYLLPITGGTAVRLTGGDSWDSRPVWSPDGKDIAFISDRDGTDHVFVVNASGGTNLRNVTDIAQAIPNRQANMEGEIRTAEWFPSADALMIDGFKYPLPQSKVVDRATPERMLGEKYHGAGRALFYLSKSEKGKFSSVSDSVAQRDDYTIWMSDRKGQVRKVSDLHANFTMTWEAPAISRDGNWVVYRDRAPISEVSSLIPGYEPEPGDVSVDTIRAFQVNKNKDRVLAGPANSPGWRSNGTRQPSTFAVNTRYAITPNSKDVLVAYGGYIHRIELKTGKDQIVPAFITVDQCLAPMADASLTLGDEDLDVKNLSYTTKSPDQKDLVFSALRRLYRYNLQNGKTTQLYPQREGQFEPAYSPDGEWIAYVTWSDTDGGHVWRVRADGTAANKLTDESGYYQSPTWSEDGKLLAYVGSQDLTKRRSGFNTTVSGGFLHIIDIDRHSVRKLPQQARFGSQLSFSMDAQRVYFTPYSSDSDTTLGLTSVRIDGSDAIERPLKSLSSYRGMGTIVVQPVITNARGVQKAGQIIAAVKFNNLYLVYCVQPLDSIGSPNLQECIEQRLTRAGGNDPRWRDEGRTLEWSFANVHYQAYSDDLVQALRSDSSENALIDRLTSVGQIERVQIDLKVPKRRASGTLALKGARLITMNGNEIIQDGTVVIRNGRIAQVGNVEDVIIPQNATVISVTGKTIMPGLIDSHAHFNQMPRDLLAENYWEPLVSLAFGITTIKNPSNGGDHAFAYSELVQTGQLIGPRIFSAPGFVVENVEKLASIQDALDMIVRQKNLGGTLVKYHTGFNRQQRRWIMQAARIADMRVASHLPASSVLSNRLNLSTVVDGATSTEHQITTDSDLFDDVKKWLIQSEVGICFAPLASYGGYPSLYWQSIQSDRRMQRFYDGKTPRDIIKGDAIDGLMSLRAAAAANAKLLADISQQDNDHILVGSHGDLSGIGMHFEMWAHAKGGMSPHNVLRAATINGARSLGVETSLGSLEVGKIADLLILDQDPTQDIRNTLSVSTVVQGGVARDAGTLNEIWPVPSNFSAGQKTKEIDSDESPVDERHTH